MIKKSEDIKKEKKKRYRSIQLLFHYFHVSWTYLLFMFWYHLLDYTYLTKIIIHDFFRLLT